MDSINYLAQLYGIKEITAENLCIDISGRSVVYRIKDKDGIWNKYKDPDTESETLYKAWEKFLKKKLPKGEFINGSFEIEAKIDKKIFVLSSDYIGPSKKWAARAFSANDKELCKEMAYILKVCRRFEGHMIWPKNQYIFLNPNDLEGRNGMCLTYGKNSQNSINMSRGGSKGVYDRFDVTLYSLKKYYDLFIKNDREEYFGKGLYDRAKDFIVSCNDKIDVKENGFRLFNLFLSFELTSEWFDIFGDFNTFTQVFELQDFIENGEPIIWGSENKITKLLDSDNNYKNYMQYIIGCTNAIKSRAKQ